MQDLEKTSGRTLQMKVSIAVATLTYDDAVGLDRLEKSIIDQVDYHIIIHTKFPEHPTRLHNSRDMGTELIIEYFKETEPRPEIIYQSLDSFTEHDARNQYLKIAERLKIDALLILDSDEYINASRTNWNQFYNDVSEQLDNPQNVFGIIGYWGIDNEKPRLWVRPYEMTYVSGSHKIFKNMHHDNFLDTEGCMQMNPIKIKSLAFIQDSSYRTQQRKKDHDVYRDWLVKHEERIKQNILL
jgi:hypothetical protein